MSHNSKNARKHATAKQYKKRKGPAKTNPTHGKKKAWFQLKDPNGRLLVLVNKTKKNQSSVATDEA